MATGCGRAFISARQMRYYPRLITSACCLLLLCLIPRVEAQQKSCEGEPLITIDRSACFGDCPVYSAEIYADGTVVYVGKRFVKTEGTQRFKISEERIAALIKEFERIDYWSLQDRYETDENGRSVTDQPTTTTSICLNGKKKQVVNYYYAPRKLDELEEKIDSLAGLYSLIGPL
ncbi:MAG TPA: DUF6438 domain-containing protein [Pyrinomonadaceae bacterium]